MSALQRLEDGEGFCESPCLAFRPVDFSAAAQHIHAVSFSALGTSPHCVLITVDCLGLVPTAWKIVHTYTHAIYTN